MKCGTENVRNMTFHHHELKKPLLLLLYVEEACRTRGCICKFLGQMYSGVGALNSQAVSGIAVRQARRHARSSISYVKET